MADRSTVRYFTLLLVSTVICVGILQLVLYNFTNMSSATIALVGGLCGAVLGVGLTELIYRLRSFRRD